MARGITILAAWKDSIRRTGKPTAPFASISSNILRFLFVNSIILVNYVGNILVHSLDHSPEEIISVSALFPAKDESICLNRRIVRCETMRSDW